MNLLEVPEEVRGDWPVYKAWLVEELTHYQHHGCFKTPEAFVKMDFTGEVGGDGGE